MGSGEVRLCVSLGRSDHFWKRSLKTLRNKNNHCGVKILEVMGREKLPRTGRGVRCQQGERNFFSGTWREEREHGWNDREPDENNG